MRAGRLRDRVTIQFMANTQDAAGEPILTWANFAVDVAAYVADMSGREYIAGETVTNAVMTTIIIRHLDGVTASMRVINRGVIYNIQAVLEPENHRRETHLMCVRNVSNG